MSSNIKSDVFRFVTVRAPQKPEAGSTREIKGLAITAMAQGTVFTALKAAKKANDSETYLAAVATFKAGSNFQGDPADFIAANEAVQALAAGFTASDVESSYSTSLGTAHETFTQSLVQNTWDSYLSEIVKPENGLVAAQMSAKIRYLVVRNHMLGDFVGQTVLDILSAPVLLSKEVFPIPKGKISFPEVVVEDTTETDALVQKWDDYEAAGIEIEKFRDCKLEEYATSKPSDEVYDNLGDMTSPSQGPNIVTDTLELAENDFSTRTNEILGEIWCTTSTGKVRIEATLIKLKKAVDGMVRELSSQLSSHAKVVGKGGVIMRTNLRKGGTDEGEPLDPPVSLIGIRPVGVGDLRVVEQSLLCYEPGEIAHIENILKGEEKERITRRLNRKESTRTYEVIRELEEERDVQTTDRYQMQQESSEVINQDNELTLGVQVSTSFGPTSVDAQVGYSSSTSTQTSNSNAVEYAKEVVDRATKRILERTREETIEKVIEEFEVTNTHKVVNTATDATHNVGIYRWVDKVYENRVVNYGKRLMFQFIVPEPAAWHLHAMSEDQAGQFTLEQPLDPREGVELGSNQTMYLKSPQDLTENNYLLWAGFYNAQGITAYPQTNKIVSKAYHYAFSGSNVPRYSDSFEMPVPTGYEVASARATVYMPFAGEPRKDHKGNMYLLMGDANRIYLQRAGGNYDLQITNILPMYWQQETFPVSFTVNHESHNHLSLNVRLRCEPTSEAIDQWKIAIYNKVMQAYLSEKAIYDNALAQLKVDSRLIQLRGNNPGRNREIERMELKKGCLQLMNAQGSVSGFSSVNKVPDLNGDPVLNVNAANAYGRFIQFFEQVFEWKQMTYQLYPYFWGKKSRWEALYTTENSDPTFTAFLQSGAARVLIPVRPGYEDQIIHFLETQHIWEGGDIPQYDDPLWVDIYDDLAIPTPVDVGDPWEVKLPTKLVALQCDSGCIDEAGLPCYREP